MAAGIDACVFVMKRAAARAPAEWARMAYGLCTRLATTCARSAAWCSGLYAGGDTCSLSPWPRRSRSTQRNSRSSLRGFEGGRLEILCPTFPRSTSRRLPVRRFLDECQQVSHFASAVTHFASIQDAARGGGARPSLLSVRRPCLLPHGVLDSRRRRSSVRLCLASDLLSGPPHSSRERTELE